MFVDIKILITNIISRVPTVLFFLNRSESLNKTYCALLNPYEISSDWNLVKNTLVSTNFRVLLESNPFYSQNIRNFERIGIQRKIMTFPQHNNLQTHSLFYEARLLWSVSPHTMASSVLWAISVLFLLLVAFLSFSFVFSCRSLDVRVCVFEW